MVGSTGPRFYCCCGRCYCYSCRCSCFCSYFYSYSCFSCFCYSRRCCCRCHCYCFYTRESETHLDLPTKSAKPAQSSFGRKPDLSQAKNLHSRFHASKPSAASRSPNYAGVTADDHLMDQAGHFGCLEECGSGAEGWVKALGLVRPSFLCPTFLRSQRLLASVRVEPGVVRGKARLEARLLQAVFATCRNTSPPMFIVGRLLASGRFHGLKLNPNLRLSYTRM